MIVSFKAKVWKFNGGTAAWYFLGVPQSKGDIIHKNVTTTRGFGSIRVSATIGKTTWQTSIFPDRRSRSYLLPVKAFIRKEEGIDEGDEVKVSLLIE